MVTESGGIETFEYLRCASRGLVGGWTPFPGAALEAST